MSIQGDYGMQFSILDCRSIWSRSTRISISLCPVPVYAGVIPPGHRSQIYSPFEISLAVQARCLSLQSSQDRDPSHRCRTSKLAVRVTFSSILFFEDV
jgi:hypothetical protein